MWDFSRLSIYDKVFIWWIMLGWYRQITILYFTEILLSIIICIIIEIMKQFFPNNINSYEMFINMYLLCGAIKAYNWFTKCDPSILGDGFFNCTVEYFEL